MELKSNQLYDVFVPYYRDYSKKRKKYLNAIDDLIKKHIYKPTRVLDVGAGDGVRGKKVFKEINGKLLIQIDSSERMFKEIELENGVKKIKMDISSKSAISELNTNFDLVLCLWNVFGHISTSKKRKQALVNIHKLIKPGGLLILDVSNAYNIRQYGLITVLKNIFHNIVNRESGVDATYPINMSTSSCFYTKSHFFTEGELISLFKSVGFRVVQKYYVDYNTGKLVVSQYLGQLLFVLSPLD